MYRWTGAGFMKKLFQAENLKALRKARSAFLLVIYLVGEFNYLLPPKLYLPSGYFSQ